LNKKAFHRLRLTLEVKHRSDLGKVLALI